MWAAVSTFIRLAGLMLGFALSNILAKLLLKQVQYVSGSAPEGSRSTFPMQVLNC